MLLRHRWKNVTTYNVLQFVYKLSKELGLQAKNEKKKRKPKYKTTKNPNAPKMIDDNFDV